MSNEASKVHNRIKDLLRSPILDIGCGSDKIHPDAQGYDLVDGDAQTCTTLTSNSYSTIFSSHCLEHMVDPVAALQRWWELLKPYGFLVLYVPDEDLYEQGCWPSTFNGDHKASFTPSKTNSWCPASLNVLDLVKALPNHKLYSLRIIDEGYEHRAPREDQTADRGAEAHIELIVQKTPTSMEINPYLVITKCTYNYD